jgi:hypothetical protein
MPSFPSFSLANPSWDNTYSKFVTSWYREGAARRIAQVFSSVKGYESGLRITDAGSKALALPPNPDIAANP